MRADEQRLCDAAGGGMRLATGIASYDEIVWREAPPRLIATARAGPISILRNRSDTRTAAIGSGAAADILVWVEEESGAERATVDGAALRQGPRPGRWCLIPAGAESDWVTNAGFACIHIHFTLSIHALAGTEGEMPVIGWDADPAVGRSVGAILSELRRDLPGRRLAVEGEALALAAHLLRRAGRREARGRGAASLAPARLRRVAELVEADPSQDLGIEALAGAAGLSPAQFSRAFRAATGETPHRWVMARRVARAKARLAEGRAPTAEIALDCGFASQSHMTDVFRRFGEPPPARFRP